MNKQKVYLNSCEILIDNIILYKQLNEYKLYFLWKKGKRFSKSNMHGFERNEIVTVNERLQLNLKIYQTNGKKDSKNARLFVMVSQDKQAQGRQLCSFVLGVHEWSSNYQKLQLQIKDDTKIIGVMNIQIKKKQVMELENFHKYNAQIQESSESEGSIMVGKTARNAIGIEYIQMQKQIEDLKYLNEKLKKDRSFLIARNDIVQKQIVDIKTIIKAELLRLQQYYEKKLSMHTSIYQQQIQQLITTFNQNSNTNEIIMRSIINQNEGLSAELTQLRIISEEQLQKQQTHYKAKLTEADDQRQRLNEIIEDLQERGDWLQKQLNQTNRNLQSTREQLENTTLNYSIDKKEFKSKCQQYQKQLQTQRKQISELKNQLSEKQSQLSIANQKQEQLHEQLQQKSSKLQKTLHDKVKLQAESQAQKMLIQSLKVQKNQTLNSLKSLQADYQAYIAEGQKRNIQHQKQLQQIQIHAKQRQFQLDKQLNIQRQNFFTQNLKHTQVSLKLQDLQKMMIVKEQQIKTLLDDNTKFNDRYLQEHQRTLQVQQQNQQLLNQLEHMKLMHDTAQAKVHMLTQQLDSAYKKNQQDLEALKDQFDQSIKNRQKYYQQEMQLQRMKLDNNQNSFLKITNEFRTQIELYKKQMQKLQQQQLKIMNQNNQLVSENKKLQFQTAQYKKLHLDTKQAMKERQKMYEQSIKMFLSGNSQFQELKGSINERRPNQTDLKTSIEKVNLLNPLSLKTPPRINIPDMDQESHNEYLKYKQEVGSLDHVKYLKSVENINKEYLTQIQDLSKKNQSLSIKIIEQEKQRDTLINTLKDQIQAIHDQNEKLKQQINFYMENEDKLYGVTSVRFQPNHRDQQQQSFGPQMQKNMKDQSMQDSGQLQKSRRSRYSKSKHFVPTKQEGVQTQVNGQRYSQTSQVQIYDEIQSLNISNKIKKQSSKESPPIKSSPRNNQQFKQLQKDNIDLLKKFNQVQSDYKQKSDEVKKKQQKIQKLQYRNRQLFDQLCNLKQQLGLKISIQQSKLLQYSQMTKKDQNQYEKMKNTIIQKQNQIRISQQNFLAIKNKIVYQNQQLVSQVKKLKKEIQQHEGKLKKGAGYGFSQLIQQDLEQSNRKVIQLNRSLNQMKMQKESAEDQTRITKKRLSDMQKNLTDVSDKRTTAEQQLQSTTRKFNKIRRDLTQRQEELAKSRQQYKKMQQQIANFSTLSSQTLVERKKYLQQKLQMQEELNKKQAQNRKLNKQLQKNLQKLSLYDEYSQQRKHDKNKQIERLQAQLIRMRKQNKEYEEQIQYLHKKITTTDQQFKQKTQQMKQYFRQKLSAYTNDINDIKNVLAMSDDEIRQLTQQRTALKEQLQKCIGYIDEIEQQNKKLNDEKNNLISDIQKNINELQETKKQLLHFQQDSIELHAKIAALEDQINKQRMISVRKSQKVEQYEMLSQKYLYELKNLKVALNDHEKKEQIQTNLVSKLKQFQNQNENLSQQLINMTKQYQKYKIQFVFTKDQVEQLVSELKQNYEQARKKQLADTIDELDQEYESKNIKRQKQIIDLYNQNAKMKILIQKKQDECSQMLQRYTQIQNYPQKYRQSKDQNEGLLQQIKYLKQQDSQMRAKYKKMQLQSKQLQRVILQLKHKLQLALTSFTNQKARANRLQQQVLEAQTGYNITKQQIKKLTNQHSDKSQSLKTLVQTYQQKLLSVQLQNSRIKQREQNMHREYKQQIKKMEIKIKQLTSSMQQHTISSQRQFKGRLAQKDRLLKQATKQLDSVAEDIKHLQNQINILKQKNDQLATQLNNTRIQMNEDQQIYIAEINKLKNNIKQMEDVYTYNVNQLEQQLAQLNRQLTMEKLSNRQRDGLTSSRLRESEVDKRLQQKLKIKDSRIQQLKNNVFMLEETVVNLKKKNQDQNDEEGSPLSKYRTLYNQLIQQYDATNKKYQLERDKQQQLQKQLRKDLSKSKQNQQQLILKYDQQSLQLASIKNQLKTIKQIYETLQSQIQKRQIKLTESMSVGTTYQKQIQYKNLKIAELQQKLNQIKRQNNEMVVKIKSKQTELQIINQKLIAQTNAIYKIKNSSLDSKKLQQLKIQQFQAMKQQLQQISKQNKRLYNQIDNLKQELSKSKNKQAESEKRQSMINKQYNQLLQKIYANQEIIGKYTAVNQKSLQNHGVTVEQLVLGGFFDQKFFDQEQQLNQLRQDIQEMKFNEDRKTLDFQQMKKQNLQLMLKMEDHQFVTEQVETLRKICDKLQQQKKIAVFRQQAIRVRLGNLIHRGEARQNIKDGLQAILNYNYNVYV